MTVLVLVKFYFIKGKLEPVSKKLDFKILPCLQINDINHSDSSVRFRRLLRMYLDSY